MEDQTKLVEEIFKEANPDECEPFFVKKLLNVSDPNNWYHSNMIICEMFHPKHWDGSDKDTIRIIFTSYDDFMMYCDFNYYNLDSNWKFCMEHYFNKLPNTVNVEWLYEHGYVPF